MTKPHIAVLMDENTSSGGNQYAMGKGYFTSIVRAGGLPFGVPYEAQILADVIAFSDGLLCPGGRFAYADTCYAGDLTSNSPPSDRLAIEKALIEGFLSLDKPVLGICAGMQLLGCLNGAKMTPDLLTTERGAMPHDEAGRMHPVSISAGSKLSQIVGASQIDVNTFHREALVSVTDNIVVSARAPDGIIEAIELPGHKFAVGVQWHPEKLTNDASNIALFDEFVRACRCF
jgi:putative glutamine amidotransferase